MVGDIGILMMDEARHRHANEFAAALATLHLVRAGSGSGNDLMKAAIDRLEAQVRIERLLLTFPERPSSIAAALDQLCQLLLRSRHGAIESRLILHAPTSARTGSGARTLLLIAYELVTNALKYGDCARMPVRVSLRCGKRNYRLIVVNEFALEEGPSIGSQGLAIAAGLAECEGGSLQSMFDATIARIAVTLPISRGEPLSNDPWGTKVDGD